MERLGTSYSSVGSDDEDFIGIYADTFKSYNWIYISDADEMLPWFRSTNEGNKFSHFFFNDNI